MCKLRDPEVSLSIALADSVERWRKECPEDERLQEAAWIAGDLKELLEKVLADPRASAEPRLELAGG